jgi:hypothetical protein
MTKAPPTRAQRQRSMAAFVAFLAGAALSWSIGLGAASWLSGDGFHPAYAYPTVPGFIAGHPFTVVTPTGLPVWLALICCAALGAVAMRLVQAIGGHGGDPREAGLGQWRDVRRSLSAHATRRAARFTRPGMTWWQRRRVPLTELGYSMGKMRNGGHPLWANFEVRVRIVARTGWGKTSRILVELVRALPGAALVGTTAPDLFEQTVLARQHGPRLPRGRRFWTAAWWRPQHGPDRQVWVVDFSEREHRIAAGWPSLRFDPIRGCEDYALAKRRGRAVVAGADDGDRGDDTDGTFRTFSGEVIAAWWHAAALGRKSMTDVLKWQRNIHDPTPVDILDTHPAAEPAAAMALKKHLDERSERTTSSMERFVQVALAPFGTAEGLAFTNATGPSLESVIREQGTIYLLASPTTASSVSPILTMLADEWFHTARQVAMSHTETGRRLPVPAVGVLDELRALVPIPSLPQVAYEMRKYGIGLVYSLQNAAQEVELYHEQAESLAANVQLTILGGYDKRLAEEVTEQAGPVAVPSPSVSGSLFEAPDYGEGVTWRDAVSGADLQKLDDGQAIVRFASKAPFYGQFASFRDDRRLRRRINREELRVRAGVAGHQAIATAERSTELAAAQAHYEKGTR